MKNENISDFLSGLVEEMAARKGMDPETQADIAYHAGSTINLPSDPQRMPIPRAIQTLTEHMRVLSQEYEITEAIPGLPLDAACAFARVLKKRYGFINAKTTQGFFGPEPPEMRRVQVGPGPEDYVEVPIGAFQLTDVSVRIKTGFSWIGKSKIAASFYISGNVGYEDRKVLMDIVSQTKAELAAHSIYRGRALRLPSDEDGDMSSLIEPAFMDVSRVKPEELILNADARALLDIAVNAPITKTEICRRHNIPLRRGVLLHGPYGTGKTLAALTTAKIAVDNDWTFVVLDNAKGLATALEFAKMFQPCVIFAEDADRVIDENESEEGLKLVNAFDSAIRKGDEVIAVLTTNHLDKLPSVMLRPGRMDALIEVGLPDQDSIRSLIGLYAGPLLDPAEDLGEVADAMVGFIPATVREAVERAKLSMILAERESINATDLRTAALGIAGHMALLSREKPEVSDEHAAGAALKKLLAGPGDEGQAQRFLDAILDKTDATDRRAVSINDFVSRIFRMLQEMGGGDVAQMAQMVKETNDRVKRIANGKNG